MNNFPISPYASASAGNGVSVFAIAACSAAYRVRTCDCTDSAAFDRSGSATGLSAGLDGAEGAAG
jgi:hypothetical protein